VRYWRVAVLDSGQDTHEDSAKERHDKPPSKRWILPFTDIQVPALQTLKVVFTE
jgi:hypothetical protein